ncbi:MAG TPA: ribbon-helix-helix protein, CopG family [Gaiellaceae bacterium]|jgi:hypothetical protein|nr:ribbon-helix-helix protein, CopG family [Gaiellaceae bacterium]
MARRLHVTISEEQYAYLDEEADRSSLSIAELVRRALDTTYALAGPARVTVIEHTLGRRPGRSVDRGGPPHRDEPRWRSGL